MRETSSKPFPCQLLLRFYIYCRTLNILKYGNTWDLWLECPFSTWDYNRMTLRLGLAQHWPGVWGISSATSISRSLWPSCVKPSSLASPHMRGHAAGNSPAPVRALPPQPRARGWPSRPAVLPRPQKGSARRVLRSSLRLPCRTTPQWFLPLVLPPSEGKTTQASCPRGFLHPGVPMECSGARAGGGRGPARVVRAPKRAWSSCHRPPRVRLCPAAAPAPAPAPQGGSSNSPR